MSAYKDGGGPGEGFFPGQRRGRCKNKTGAALTPGQHVMLDLANVTTGLSIIPGGDPGTSIWNTVIDPDVASFEAQAYPILVSEGAVAIDADGWFGASFVGPANVDGATVAGDRLTPAADNQLDVSGGAAGERVVAIALTADTANIATVWFFGGEPGNNDI